MSSDEITVEFEEASDSELMKVNKLGRPRDITFDRIVKKAYDAGVAQRCIVPNDSKKDVVNGLRRGARHLEVSISYLVFEPDEANNVVIEFIAYPTQRRDKRKGD